MRSANDEREDGMRTAEEAIGYVAREMLRVAHEARRQRWSIEALFVTAEGFAVLAGTPERVDEETGEVEPARPPDPVRGSRLLAAAMWFTAAAVPPIRRPQLTDGRPE